MVEEAGECHIKLFAEVRESLVRKIFDNLDFLTQRSDRNRQFYGTATNSGNSTLVSFKCGTSVTYYLLLIT
jgi:hypothetical protein